MLVRPDADPLQLNAAIVSQNLAAVLGIDMQLGRNFRLEEDVPGGPSVTVLTDRLWRDAFGADPRVVGSSLTIDDRPFEVVGVLPAGLDYPARQTDAWVPIQQSRATAVRPQHWVRVVGRLQAGATVASAQADMARIMADLEVEYANDNQNRGAFVEKLANVGRADVRSTLWVLFASVLAVLAIACVNVANLLLARGASRSRELAVLKAVGAGNRHITRKFIVEGALITALAAASGIGLAAGGVRLLTVLARPSLLLLGEPAMNLQVLTFALGTGALICIGFGLLPALQARGLDVHEHLKDGGTTERGTAGFVLRRMLVAGQLSLAVVLLLGATLLIGTVRNLQSIDPGFRAENSLRVDFALPTRYEGSLDTYPNWPVMQQFLSDLTAEAEAIPGIESATVVTNHPLDAGFTNSFRIEGHAYDPSQGEMTTRLVTPGYFETTGVELLAGRRLDDSDRAGAPDAIVLNQSAADRYFPEGDAVGKRIAFWGPTFREVVGIISNERLHGLTAEIPPAMYVSMYQAPPLRGGKMTLMVHTQVAPLSVVDGVRVAMRRVDPDIPVFNVSTMEATVADALARERFASTVLNLFAGVALFLAMLGVHGVLAYLVAQRSHEVGVRMALGATRRDVVNMVVRQGASMTVIGIVLGLVVAFAVSGLIQGLLYGVSATAPMAYAGVAITLGIVALAAAAVPAHRAASISPVSSLRGE